MNYTFCELDFIPEITPPAVTKAQMFSRLRGITCTFCALNLIRHAKGMTRIPRAGVYAIKNLVNGRVYVGGSTDLKRRMNGHAKTLRDGGAPNQQIWEDLKRYGVDAFSLVVLERTDQREQLPELEKAWADRLNAFTEGYNLRQPHETNFRPKHFTRAQAPA